MQTDSLRLALVLCLAGLALWGCGREPPSAAAPAAPSAADVALNNRGVALMGHFDYPGAHEVFSRLAEQNPRWLDARINLAIATLNRQQEGDDQAALAILAAVLDEDPESLRALYMSGLLYHYLGDNDRARSYLEIVAQNAPDDAYAAYYLGQAVLQQGDTEAAVRWFRRAMEADPYLRSSYYGALLALRRLGREDEAGAMKDAYERFADNPRATLAEIKYTRMGPLAAAVAADAGPQPLAPAPQGPVFGPRGPLAELASGSLAGAALTTADIDGDGVQDLFVAVPQGGASAVLAGRTGGTYEFLPAHPLSGIGNVAAAVWGDVDNDGHVDVYLCGHGMAQLWLQGTDGWAPAGGKTGSDKRCNDAALFDADHDGDLDIFAVYEDAPAELFNNDMAGRFRPIAADQGIAGRAGGRQVLSADLDGDRDTDIAVFHAEPPHEIRTNDRLWTYRDEAAFAALRAAPVQAAVAGDADADGRLEIYVLDPQGQVARWDRDPAGLWFSRPLELAAQAGATQIALQDFTGNGAPELLIAGPSGTRVVDVSGGVPQVLQELSGAIALVSVLEDPVSGPGLAGFEAGSGTLWRQPPGPGRYPFLALKFSGREERAESMRSNASGIGTRIALRADSRWSITSTFDKHSGPGQSLQPVALGLGGLERADYLSIDWSDGVFQTELDLAPGPVHRITETQRQLSSCPVLFAWDGEKYRFVSDLLGVGGLGFFIAPGQYATPRPHEALRLPQGLLQAAQGRLRLKLGEPMEEIAYIDAVSLRVYDLPAGWSLALDERMAVNSPQPGGEALFYRQTVTPQKVTNERGEDVTAALAAADLSAAPPGALDARLIGRLAGEHVLTLEFAEDLSALDGQTVLLADGWVEYPYSQTVFAAWQADERFAAPTLEAATATGGWQTIAAEFGYPAGMPREMALPLQALPAGTRRLRIRSNLQIYWDRLRVVVARPLPGVTPLRLDPVYARLAVTGFPERSDGPQRQPGYDYAARRPFWDTRYPAGLYTTPGPVTELVSVQDDAFAIVGPGEELHFEFAADLPPVADDVSRVFVLDTHGYAKDMDLYTRDGGTVGPLPLSRDDREWVRRRDALHARFHLRYMAGK